MKTVRLLQDRDVRGKRAARATADTLAKLRPGSEFELKGPDQRGRWEVWEIRPVPRVSWPSWARRSLAVA